MPMMALSVVVLPAPLRPSSVTTSPACTSKLTPCRMWDSPYHACRSRTDSSASGNAGAHVRLDDVRIAGHRGVVALGEDLPAGKDRDRVGQLLDHAQVVLHHEHGPVHGDALDQRRD